MSEKSCHFLIWSAFPFVAATVCRWETGDQFCFGLLCKVEWNTKIPYLVVLKREPRDKQNCVLFIRCYPILALNHNKYLLCRAVARYEIPVIGIMCAPPHRRAFCQFPFQWIYYYGSNKSTGKETGKTHLCAPVEIGLTLFQLDRQA